MPRPAGGCHQCWTSPSRNWCDAAQDVRPGDLGRGVDQGHHVLELVAEAERAARLVEARARPVPAGEHLVEQPAVGQQVERRVGRLHLHDAQATLPAALTSSSVRAARPGSRYRRTIERADSTSSASPSRKTTSAWPPGSSSIAACNAAHGSIAAPTRPDEVLAAHRGRGGERAVPAEERQAIGRDRARPPVDVGERHPGRRSRSRNALRASRAPVSASTSVTTCMAGHVAVQAQHPLGVERRREPAGPVPRYSRRPSGGSA